MECNEIYSVSAFVQPEANSSANAGYAGLGSALWKTEFAQPPGKDSQKFNRPQAPEINVHYHVYSVNDGVRSEANGNDLEGEKQRVRIESQKQGEFDANGVRESEKGQSKVDVVESDSRCSCKLRKDLLGIKLFYFSWIGALGCVLPYVVVFLKQMGLSPLQIGVISGIRPIIGFLSGPIWGTLGDKFNIRKILLMISLTAWLSFYIGLYFIPRAARIEECPENLQPHRDHIPVRSRRNIDPDPMNTSTPSISSSTDLLSTAITPTVDIYNENYTYNNNLSAHDMEILKESVGWTYKPGPLNKVFITSLLVIVAGEFFQAPTGALSDAGTLHTLGPEEMDGYGAQRAWGAIGWAICSLIGGGIVSSSRLDITICGVPLVVSDYHMLVYVFTGFMALAYMSAAAIKFKPSGKRSSESGKLTGSVLVPNVKEEMDKEHSLMSVIKVFCNLHYGSWIMTAFYVGVCNGVIWGFLYWHLDNLGATQLLMGIDSVVGCVAEFISFFLVGHVIKLVGHMGITYLGLVGYCIRFLIYAFLKNPWWVLPAEILQGATFSLIWASLTAYTAQAVPPGSLATVQGIVHGVYFGLGNGVGHLLGGVMVGELGAVITFIVMASSCVVVLVLFATAQKCSKKPNKSFAYQDLDESS